MKTYQGLILFVLTLFLTSFTTTLEIDDVVTALKTGNANQLSRYFDNRVDLTLPDKSDNYSRTQAEMILKDFFNSNSVKSFELKHKGENSGSKFCIGILHTKNGNYRTKLFMKLKDNKQVLQEIAFQSE